MRHVLVIGTITMEMVAFLRYLLFFVLGFHHNLLIAVRSHEFDENLTTMEYQRYRASKSRGIIFDHSQNLFVSSDFCHLLHFVPEKSFLNLTIKCESIDAGVIGQSVDAIVDVILYYSHNNHSSIRD